MEKSLQDIKELADYMGKVVDEIPAGLKNLKDAATFALFDINCFVKRGIKTRTYNEALAFAESIPRVDNVQDDALTTWMLNDQEYKKYLP